MTGIGHNMPPAIDAFSMELDNVYTEAKNWLDGAAIENQAQADAVGVIMSTARKIKKDADAARAEEKRPHDEAGKAVQAKWKPLLDRADAILSAAQKPLATFLQAEQDRQRAEAERARLEAHRLQQEAIAKQRESAGNLEATEEAAELQKQADKAVKIAAKAEKARPNVAGADRAIGLRTAWVGVVTDRRELLAHVMRHDPEALTAFLSEYARKAVAGGTRSLPGVDITPERKAA